MTTPVPIRFHYMKNSFHVFLNILFYVFIYFFPPNQMTFFIQGTWNKKFSRMSKLLFSPHNESEWGLEQLDSENNLRNACLFHKQWL